jgi:hypothetical protein
MNILTSRLSQIAFTVSVSVLLIQCSTNQETQNAPPVSEVSKYKTPKKILIFLDGTNNEWDSRTNVRRCRPHPCRSAAGFAERLHTLANLVAGAGR